MSVKFRIGRQIKAKEVRYIDNNGVQQGVVSLDEAIKHADSVGLSLVEVDPHGTPPVCKILDYNRFQFEKKKKNKAASGSGVKKKDKEVKITTSTGENDYLVKLRKITSLLESGHRVKVSIRFRFRREHSAAPQKPEIVDRIISDLKDIAKSESDPKLDGRQAILYFIKKKK